PPVREALARGALELLEASAEDRHEHARHGDGGEDGGEGSGPTKPSHDDDEGPDRDEHPGGERGTRRAAEGEREHAGGAEEGGGDLHERVPRREERERGHGP